MVDLQLAHRSLMLRGNVMRALPKQALMLVVLGRVGYALLYSTMAW
jgi:hypothetical protein